MRVAFKFIDWLFWHEYNILFLGFMYIHLGYNYSIGKIDSSFWTVIFLVILIALLKILQFARNKNEIMAEKYHIDWKSAKYHDWVMILVISPTAAVLAYSFGYGVFNAVTFAIIVIIFSVSNLRRKVLVTQSDL